MAKDFDLGNATSYSYYVSEGGTKSPEEFGEMLVNIDTVATRAEAAASGAAESEENADQSKTAAQAAAGTATTKATEASQSATAAANAASAAQADADAAALDASQAMSAASTATSKATEAASSASTATAAKTDAVTAKTAAQAAQTAAETAEDNAETSATAAAASAASVAGCAAQITQNAADINELKSDLSDVNAELADVRVGADGTTYANAGAAVRGQIDNLHKNLSIVHSSGYSNVEYKRTGYKTVFNDVQFVNGHTYTISGKYTNANNIGNLRITFDDTSTENIAGTSSNDPTFSVNYVSTKTSIVKIDQYANTIGGNLVISIKDITNDIDIDLANTSLDRLANDVSILKKDIWNVGNGLPILSDGVISIMSSSSFTLFGAIAEENTDYTIYRHGAGFTTLNRIFVLFLTKVIYSKAEFDASLIVGEPTIETSSTQGFKKDSYKSPVGTKMIMICVPNSDLFWQDGRNSTPTIIYTNSNGEKVIVPNTRDTLTLDDIALNPAASIQQDGSVLFDATNSALSLILPNIYKTNDADRNSVFTFVTKAEGTTNAAAPNIIFKTNKLYQTIPYDFTSAEFTENQFRMPYFGDFEYYGAQLIIPAGMKLYIKRVSHYHTDHKRTYTTGVRLSSHLGMITLAPENSAIGFKIAAKVGYPSAICNPKVTSDGVLICYHDPKINTTARNADGTAISNDVFIASNTFETLNQYDYGIYLDPMYAGTKLLTLDEFFKICAVYSIAPIFSIHHSSNPLSAADWTKIKTMCQKYGLTESLLIKSGSIEGLEVAYETMGDSVFGYVFDLGGVTVANGIAAFDASQVHNTKARKYIGISKTVITDESVNSVINAGYMCELYDIYATRSLIYKHYIDLGVSEFVDDQNPSYGYLW